MWCVSRTAENKPIKCFGLESIKLPNQFYGFTVKTWTLTLQLHSWHKSRNVFSYNKKRQMLQADPFIVAAGRCGRGDGMCRGEALAFVATQPTGPEPWPPTLNPGKRREGGKTKLWVTSETRNSVGRECLDRTQVTPLTPQKRFMAIYFHRLTNFESRRLCQK